MLYEKGNIVNEASKKCKELEEKLKKVNAKLDKIRVINLSCTTFAFIIHMLGAALTQPILIIAALSLVSVNLITGPRFFKLMSKAEKIQKEIDATKQAIDIGSELEIFPEFSPLNGLMAIEVREISNDNIQVKKSKEKTHTKSR